MSEKFHTQTITPYFMKFKKARWVKSPQINELEPVSEIVVDSKYYEIKKAPARSHQSFSITGAEGQNFNRLGRSNAPEVHPPPVSLLAMGGRTSGRHGDLDHIFENSKNAMIPSS
jgi:hypothetical protein